MSPEPNRQAQIWGAVREMLTALGGALAAYGVLNDSVTTAIVGAFVALAAVLEAVHAHVGREKLLTLARKALSATGGALVAVGVIEDAQVQAILGVLVPAVALAWSLQANADPPARLP